MTDLGVASGLYHLSPSGFARVLELPPIHLEGRLVWGLTGRAGPAGVWVLHPPLLQAPVSDQGNDVVLKGGEKDIFLGWEGVSIHAGTDGRCPNNPAWMGDAKSHRAGPHCVYTPGMEESQVSRWNLPMKKPAPGQAGKLLPAGDMLHANLFQWLSVPSVPVKRCSLCSRTALCVSPSGHWHRTDQASFKDLRRCLGFSELSSLCPSPASCHPCHLLTRDFGEPSAAF